MSDPFRDMSAGSDILGRMDIKVCSWNIMGDAKVEYRKEATTETFTYNASMSEADIICIQELGCIPTLSTAKEYLPFLECRDFGCCYSKETGNKYNAVFYDKSKFKFKGDKYNENIMQAFELMKLKQRLYKYIAKKRSRIKKASKQILRIPSWARDERSEEVFQEVLGEVQDDADFVKERAKLKKAKTLLRERMAICCLEARSLPGSRIIVTSIHNYSKKNKEKYASLLFDFIEKLEGCVLIAGDFNRDVTSFVNEKADYCIQNYSLKDLRRGKRIDFIILKKAYEMLSETTAHDFHIPSGTEKIITNHNPLTAVVTIDGIPSLLHSIVTVLGRINFD